MIRAPSGSRVLASASGILLPLACYLAGVALLGNWIMDDAGISYAYARNLASGHGLVSQPGRPPVEGFSNLLWVLLLAPSFALRIFHPVLTPKIIGALLFAGALTLVFHVMRRETGRLWPGAFAALALAVSPPLVIWTTSGLENGLFLLLAVGLWALLVRRPQGWPALSGFTAGLLAATRPDGLVFVACVPALIAIDWHRQPASRTGTLRRLTNHLCAAGSIIAPLFIFRLWYFRLPWPHTFYAKRGWQSAEARLADLVDHPGAALAHLADLCRGAAGPLGPWILAAALAGVALLAARRRLGAPAGTAVLVASAATWAYVWLENDWMGEYRFGTVAVAMGWVSIAGIFHDLSRLRPVPGWEWRWLLGAAVLLAATLPGFASRLWRFAANPPTTYADVSRQYAQRFNAYAAALGLTRGSILIADCGAMLMESRLTVYDAAGLFEPAVVAKLKRHTPVWHYNHPAFNDWVLGEVKPTFVSTHAFWTNVTALEQDPRFGRDYAPLEAFKDTYVKRVYGRDLHSGDFVRIDALPSGFDLARLRASYRPAPRRPAAAHRLADLVRSLRGAAPVPRELQEEARRVLDRDPNRAVELLERALADAPRDGEALLLLGSALDAAGRSGEARPVWERLRELAGATDAAGLLAVAGERLGPPAGSAHAGAERAAAPPSPPATPEGWLALSLQRYRERRFRETIDACRNALALRPGYAAAYNNICAAHNGLGEWARAIEACTEALRLDPGFALARNNLAWARSQAGAPAPQAPSGRP